MEVSLQKHTSLPRDTGPRMQLPRPPPQPLGSICPPAVTSTPTLIAWRKAGVKWLSVLGVLLFRYRNYAIKISLLVK